MIFMTLRRLASLRRATYTSRMATRSEGDWRVIQGVGGACDGDDPYLSFSGRGRPQGCAEFDRRADMLSHTTMIQKRVENTAFFFEILFVIRTK